MGMRGLCVKVTACLLGKQHLYMALGMLANIGRDGHVQHIIDSRVNIVSPLDVVLAVGLVALLVAAVLQAVPLQLDSIKYQRTHGSHHPRLAELAPEHLASGSAPSTPPSGSHSVCMTPTTKTRTTEAPAPNRPGNTYGRVILKICAYWGKNCALSSQTLQAERFSFINLAVYAVWHAVDDEVWLLVGLPSERVLIAMVDLAFSPNILVERTSPFTWSISKKARSPSEMVYVSRPFSPSS
ncbi:hypothetical protein EYF80_028936 [Liparis tanakae]|uniref:Uncharacterized protein n=1 Tax=Liparis tanakae TaxID=230148 RepID=A0A4Z2H4Z1_9TELE|nr:hypothetical protein EYF80_028936 [Liparis tanakae]